MNDIFKNNRGGTLLFMVVLILTSILTVTLAASDIIRAGLFMGRIQVHSTKAYFASEAGAERILWEIRKNGVNPGDGSGYCSDNPADFCFDDAIFGDLAECVTIDNCGINSNFTTQEMSNNAIYEIRFKYKEDGSGNSTTTLSSLGSFEDVGRAVELRY